MEGRLFGNLRVGYWLLLTVAAAEFTIGFLVGTTVGNIEPSSIFTLNGLSKMLPAWLILPLLWLGLVAITITRRRIDRPALVMWRLVRRNRYWLLRGLLFTAMVFPLGRAFTAFKSAIPSMVPFYADPIFVAADKIVFMGVDPWRITHAVIGPWGTVLIDRIYVLWFVVMMLLLGWLNFTRNQRLQLRGLLTYVLAWAVLGNMMATAFSSVGPCFYEEFFHNKHYASLMDILRSYDEDHRLFALGSMRYLLNSLGEDRLGAGISAMPSLHVTIAYLCFLVTLEGVRSIWPKVLAGAFALLIFVGSIHLGWHYAVDGLVGIFVVTLIWIATGHLIAWLDRRSQPVSVAGEERLYLS